MKTKLIALSLVAGVLAVCLPVLAHHGNAAYEANLTEIKNATVTKLVWANPHTLVLFDVKDDKGEVVHWNAEMGSPSALANVGWNKVSLMPGDIIEVREVTVDTVESSLLVNVVYALAGESTQRRIEFKRERG